MHAPNARINIGVKTYEKTIFFYVLPFLADSKCGIKIKSFNYLNSSIDFMMSRSVSPPRRAIFNQIDRLAGD